VEIRLTINGTSCTLCAKPGDSLLEVLRRAGYTGVKRGCEAGTCGSCVVLLDGVPRYSCLVFAAAASHRQITTIEGLGTPTRPHPIMRAFAEEGGVQCGYCVPGMVLSAKALLDANPTPSEPEVRQAIDGHLCRCTGYVKQVRAILRAAELLAEDNPPEERR
jgi:aerobic-type carbon monoxide dehydrogenase small subunit (CoxS/CutS family)